MNNSTICAISTPPGVGGIAVIRISGPDAINITDKIWRGKPLASVNSHTVHLGTIFDPLSNEDLDTAVATIYHAPKSYTGENVVELSIHGSQWIQRELLNILIRNGATLAEPGEFTRRAVINQKLDLAEAEAVGDIIAASSRAAQRIALSHIKGHYSQTLENLRKKLLEISALVELELDFSEEDVQFADRQQLLNLATQIQNQVTKLAESFSTGNAIKNGIPVAIIGTTNAGKSTILNRLLGEDKAIVSNIHGTTRDTIEDTIEINGTLFRLIDTAGLRNTSDPIETIGINRALKAATDADIILWIIDPANHKPNSWLELAPHIASNTHLIAVINKKDLNINPPQLPERINKTIRISALKDPDLTPVTNELQSYAQNRTTPPELTVTNARHYQALTKASQAITRAIEAINQNTPGDLLAQHLRETAANLAAITSPLTTPELLSHIFSHFCIGK